jgi:hypothetical protein
MVVGKDISMEEVTNFTRKTLTGCFCGKEFRVDAMRCWVELNWKPLLGYSPEAHAFVQGWSCFFFKAEEDYR